MLHKVTKQGDNYITEKDNLGFKKLVDFKKVWNNLVRITESTKDPEIIYNKIVEASNRFPLVLPIEQYADGFLGLNLHYIHPKQRLILMDKLSSYANNDKFDKTTKLKLTYQTLKAASRIFEKNACIKRYLFTQIQSRFLEISAEEWDIAVLLPMEDFTSKKKPVSKSVVFQDSKDTF